MKEYGERGKVVYDELSRKEVQKAQRINLKSDYIRTNKKYIIISL